MKTITCLQIVTGHNLIFVFMNINNRKLTYMVGFRGKCLKNMQLLSFELRYSSAEVRRHFTHILNAVVLSDAYNHWKGGKYVARRQTSADE